MTSGVSGDYLCSIQKLMVLCTTVLDEAISDCDLSLKNFCQTSSDCGERMKNVEVT